jgi:hypothetical protein
VNIPAYTWAGVFDPVVVDRHSCTVLEVSEYGRDTQPETVQWPDGEGSNESGQTTENQSRASSVATAGQ